jgi:hypothetical protein
MRAILVRLALSVLVSLSTACSKGPSSSRAPQADRSVITHEQLLEHNFNNAFEAVEALHSTWMQARGVDSFSKPGQVWVYLDDAKLGSVETLRTIAINSVNFIRHFDGMAATARWGLDHGQGVIFISTRVGKDLNP